MGGKQPLVKWSRLLAGQPQARLILIFGKVVIFIGQRQKIYQHYKTQYCLEQIAELLNWEYNKSVLDCYL